MQIIQLKTEEYKFAPSSDNLFQLKPLSSQSSFQIALQYNFAPLYCLKTEKIIRTLPSISQQKSNLTLFNTAVDIQFNIKNTSQNAKKCALQSYKSMKNIGQIEKTIFVPKPVSYYCQICRQTFSDYLQHINHSSHQKKLKDCAVTKNDFIQIEGILKKKNNNLNKKKQRTGQKTLQFKQEVFINQVNSKIPGKQSKKTISFNFYNQQIQTKQRKRQQKKIDSQQKEEDVMCVDEKYGSKKRIFESIQGYKKLMTIPSLKNVNQLKLEIKKSQIDIISLEKDQLEKELMNFNFDLN